MDHAVQTPCEYARERHRNMARWRDLWTILLFILGAAVILFLVAAIFLFIRSEWLPGALTTLGTIVTGAGANWVRERRIDAVKEEEAAYADVGAKCGDTKSADEFRAKKQLLGRFR